MILLLITVFIVCLCFRFPIAFSLGLSCLVYFFFKGTPLVVVPLKMYAGIDVFVLLSIPGFIIAGNLMNQGGLTDKIINFCNHLLGHIRGGLSYVNISASMLFAGISGTAISDTASLGAVMIPAMKKEGYDSDFSCAITAASSTVGPIIPPSLPMIIAATLSGLSVGKLFLAGAIPGLLLGLGLMLVAYFVAKKKKLPQTPKKLNIANSKKLYRYLLGLVDDLDHSIWDHWGSIHSHRGLCRSGTICVVYWNICL